MRVTFVLRPAEIGSRGASAFLEMPHDRVADFALIETQHGMSIGRNLGWSHGGS